MSPRVVYRGLRSAYLKRKTRSVVNAMIADVLLLARCKPDAPI